MCVARSGARTQRRLLLSQILYALRFSLQFFHCGEVSFTAEKCKAWSSGPHPKGSRIQNLLRETKFSTFALQRHARTGFGLSHDLIGISNLKSEIWYRLLRLLLKLIQHHSYLSQLVA